MTNIATSLRSSKRQFLKTFHKTANFVWSVTLTRQDYVVNAFLGSCLDFNTNYQQIHLEKNVNEVCTNQECFTKTSLHKKEHKNMFKINFISTKAVVLALNYTFFI